MVHHRDTEHTEEATVESVEAGLPLRGFRVSVAHYPALQPLSSGSAVLLLPSGGESDNIE